MIEKFFKDLAKEPQDFSPLPENSVEETENLITSEMIFIGLYNKIVQAKKFLKKKYVKEALVKKLAEFRINHSLQTMRILLNVEIKRQFSSNISRNIFNKKKCSATNIYKIFSTEGLGRDDIKRIRKFGLSAFEKSNEKEMEAIQERIITTFS
ncbi:1854_t:CDS:2 [Funneliformis caledonium]|uniref:1854_t:CDS:1 n=1 Tax=Funneliformis caledonium TaxID=1117310 RepID=A0A9N9HCA8_9GLOM|nr:1854_t:CDS:2 [Funneliformis caledonium]